MCKEGVNRLKVSDVPILARREIEAVLLARVFEKLTQTIGRSEALRIITEVVGDEAYDNGKKLATIYDSNSLEEIQHLMEPFQASGALEMEFSSGNDFLKMNVTHCEYANMYNRLGIKELGYSLSCQRDYYLFKGYNPQIEFRRTQTIMQGCPICDFHFYLPRSQQDKETE